MKRGENQGIYSKNMFLGRQMWMFPVYRVPSHSVEAKGIVLKGNGSYLHPGTCQHFPCQERDSILSYLFDLF